MELFNKNSFGRLKASVKRSGLSLQVNVQRLIEQGLSHFLETGDVCYLNQAMNVAVEVKSIRTVAMQSYIQHVANVDWTERKGKNGKFKTFKLRSDDEGNKQEPTVDQLYVQETKWFDHTDLGQDKPDMDFNAQLKSLITRTENALNEHRLAGDEGEVAEKLATLKTLAA